VPAQQNTTPFTATSPSYYSATTLTSKIISFNSIINRKKVLLSWTVGENQESDRFEVERSTDAKKFVFAAMVFGSDKAGIDYYQFYEKMKKAKTYYRVKTVAKDGTVSYSSTIMAGSM
jgi:hypothetical protein